MTTCTCILSESDAAVLDAVNHFSGCALLGYLEARIAGDLMDPADFSDPDEPVWFIAPDGRFMAFPGVDGGLTVRV